MSASTRKSFRTRDEQLAELLLDRHLLTHGQLREVMGVLDRKRRHSEEDSLARLLTVKGFVDPDVLGRLGKELKARKAPVPGYELLHRISGGRGAKLFLAHDIKRGRNVAVQVITEEGAVDKVRVKRFLGDAKLALSHTNPTLVRVFDFGWVGPCPFMSMELGLGDTLATRIRQRPSTEHEVVQWGVQIAEALDSLDRRRAFHGDLRPDRYVLTPTGALKIKPPGFSRPIDKPPTNKKFMHVAAPELLNGRKRASIRTDIFAMGSLLYRLVTGRWPYEGSTPDAVMASHRSGDATPARDLLPSISAPLSMCLSRCLQVDRSKRYRRPGEVLSDLKALQRVVASQPVYEAQAVAPAPPPAPAPAPAPAPRSGPRPSRVQASSSSPAKTISTVAIVLFCLVVGWVLINMFVKRGGTRRRTVTPRTVEPVEEEIKTSRESEAAELHAEGIRQFNAKQWSKARATLERVYQEYALTSYVTDRSGEITTQIEGCWRMLAADRSAEAKGRWADAQEAVRKADYDTAIAVYQEIIEKAEKDSIDIKIARKMIATCEGEAEIGRVLQELRAAYEGKQYEVVEGAAKKLLDDYINSLTTRQNKDEILHLRSQAKAELVAFGLILDAAKAADDSKWDQVEKLLTRLDKEHKESQAVEYEAEQIETIRKRLTAARSEKAAMAAAAAIDRADKAFEEKRYAEAAEAYEKLLRDHAAEVKDRKADFESRIAQARELGTQLGETRALHAYALARSFQRTSEWDKAIEWYVRLLTEFGQTQFVQKRKHSIENEKEICAEERDAASKPQKDEGK